VNSLIKDLQSLHSGVSRCTTTANVPADGSWIKDAAKLIKHNWELCKYRDAAIAFCTFKETLNLSGDFSLIEKMIQQMPDSCNEQALSTINQEVVEAGKFLKEYAKDIEKRQCLEAFVECQKIVEWIRSETADVNSLFNFVTVALGTGAGGEGDLTTDRLSNLRTIGSGYGPLIYKLKDTSGFNELQEYCKILWETLKHSPNLPDMMRTCEEEIEWYKSVKVMQGPVEVTSFGQMRNINEYGYYVIGTAKKGLLTSRADGILLELNQPRDKNILKSSYTLDDLRDLESKLVLITGHKSEERHGVYLFINVFHSVCRITDVLMDLQQHGNNKYIGWTMRFSCAMDDIVHNLQEQAVKMEDDFKNWQEELTRHRKQYYELNYYTTPQLLSLREELGQYKGTFGQPIPTKPIKAEVMSLVQCISRDVTSESVKDEILTVSFILQEQTLAVSRYNTNKSMQLYSKHQHKSMILDDMETQDMSHQLEISNICPSGVSIRILKATSSNKGPQPSLKEEDLTDKQKATVDNLMEQCGFSKKLIYLAFERCAKPDLEDAVRDWCNENEEKFADFRDSEGTRSDIDSDSDAESYKYNDDDDDVSLEGLFISMLDPSTDVMNCQDNTTVKSYSKLGIFSIKLKIIKLLQILFKQYIYLAVEQLLFDFCNVKDNTIRSFPTDMFNPPSILCTKDISSQMNSLQLSALYKNIDKYFQFKHYQIFDPRHNQKLTDILLSLIWNEHYNMQSNCAKLLYEIDNRENIMLDYAKSAYIVLSEKSFYEEMTLYGSFHHGYNHLKLLIQGSGNQEVCDVLDQLISLMIVGEDETEIKTCVQNIMSTTGIFSSVMKYILKFCPCPVLDETQTKVFNSLCVLLQTMCRRNEKIQGEIFVHFSDLLKVTRYTASPIANLLTEVFTDNVRLCEKLPETLIRNVYELASTNSDSVGFLDFMVTLEAVIKPFKSTDINSALIIKENIVAQAFSETHQDIFKELMTKDNANQRIKILKECTDESVDLMKLIYLTNLLATCCKGHNMFCENICQDIFTLEELVEILTDPQIPIKYKTPFAQILLECYLSTERESIVSLHKLSTNIMFWNHVTTCVQYLISIPETITDEDKRMKIKYFLKKVFEMHMSQTSTYNVDEALKPVCYILHYFTRGIGPLLTSLCVQLKLYKFKKLTMVEYQRITDPLCPTLNELANAIANLLSPQNEEIFLTNKAQANFWFNILTSINNIIPHSVSHQIDFDNGNFFLSKELIKYNYSVQSEVKLNEQFQCFISNYKSINSYNLFDSPRIKDFVELLPDGYMLMRLAGFIPEEHRQHVQSQHAKDFDPKSLIILIEVLFDKIHVNSSKLKATYRQILTSCFKILIGDFCMIIQKIDSSKDWEMEYEKKIKPMQAALMDSKLPQIVLRHINYPDDDITVHLLAFFMTLFWHGNEDTQTKFHDIIEENDSFFIRIHKLITFAISCFKHSVKFTIKNEGSVHDEYQAINDKELTQSHSCDLVTQVDVKGNLESRRLLNMTSFHEEMNVVLIQELDNVFESHQYTTDVTLLEDELEKTKDIVLQRASFVMRLLSAMCDGQHRAMQNTLRYQKQCKTRYNIVCDVASLMQFLVEVPVLSNIPVINDAIQALIEMCAGNFDNQHIALNGQVIGSINIILKNPLESVEGIRMQCKAIELLEVLLEETDVKYSEIFEAISKDLQISCVTCFIRNAYKNSSIDSNKKIDNTCIVTRNIFRAYHILLNLASKVKASFGEFVGLDDWDNIQEEPWRYLKKNTYSIEVNYITKDDKEILTKVYFPFSHQREMTKEEQCKLQAEINRDGPEEKVKDLLEWTQSVWKNDKHKRKLERYAAIKGLLFGL
jgi:hypothetical protein